jgi:hypothetical protein
MQVNKGPPQARGVLFEYAAQLLPSMGPPQARGGASSPLLYVKVADPSAPRSWGCFRHYLADASFVVVRPTLVGVLHGGSHRHAYVRPTLVGMLPVRSGSVVQHM